MHISLPTDQEVFLGQLVAAGRFDSVDEAVSEGVRLLVSQERLKEQIQIGLDQADRGDLIDHDTVFSQVRKMAAGFEANRS